MSATEGRDIVAVSHPYKHVCQRGAITEIQSVIFRRKELNVCGGLMAPFRLRDLTHLCVLISSSLFPSRSGHVPANLLSPLGGRKKQRSSGKKLNCLLTPLAAKRHRLVLIRIQTSVQRRAGVEGGAALFLVYRQKKKYLLDL